MALAGHIAIALLMAWATSAAGQEVSSKQKQIGLLNEAQESFEQGTALARRAPAEAVQAFRQAAEAYQGIIDSGVRNGRLYYNLGNARLKCGQLGRAIAAYRRAERLSPTDARLRENLRYARSLCRYDIPETGERAVARTVLFWHYRTPLRLRLLVGLGAYVLFWICLMGRTLVRRVQWKYPVAVCLLAWVATAASVAADLNASATHRQGVITTAEVVVRKGNGEGYEPQFEQALSEGVEFEVAEQRDDWLHIRLADGKEGWIRLPDAELI